MRTVALAAVIGLAATAVAAGVAASGRRGGHRVRVVRVRSSGFPRVQPSGRPVVVIRDAASESRFGAGHWDRAVLARLVTSLSRAGATVIGLEASLEQPSPPGRGGASSDALVSQAIALAENVVLPIALEPADALDRAARDSVGTAPPGHHSWPPLSGTVHDLPKYRPITGSLPGFAQYAKAVGHTLVSADPDGVVRRMPLFVRVGDRRVPAYGLALAAASANVETTRIPVDRHGRGARLRQRPATTTRLRGRRAGRCLAFDRRAATGSAPGPGRRPDRARPRRAAAGDESGSSSTRACSPES